MKQSEINKLTITELQEKLGEFKKSYADLKMAHAISSLEKPIQLRNVNYNNSNLPYGKKKFKKRKNRGCYKQQNG